MKSTQMFLSFFLSTSYAQVKGIKGLLSERLSDSYGKQVKHSFIINFIQDRVIITLPGMLLIKSQEFIFIVLKSTEKQRPVKFS